MTTPLIVIEGIDGSGKGTQAARLVKRLEHHNRRVQLLSFPRYTDTFFGEAIGRFLNGQFGDLQNVHPALVSLLYAGDRFESRSVIETAQSAAEVIVCDRYVPSNLAHQGGRLQGAERLELIRWIEQLEYDLYLVVLFDLPVSLAQELISRKSKRSYTDRAADIQEADTQYLSQVRETYHTLARANPETWSMISCHHENDIRPLDEIEQDVWTLVRERFPELNG
ncbi:MAG: dTMP kinase [Planctomycetota bacterium]|nr:dTMP kinase [Planctomycetota bacterium]